MTNEVFELDFGNRKVNIKKLQLKSVQGRHKHTHNGKNMKKTQAGKAATKWAIPDNKALNRLNTGLWLYCTNPWKSGKDGENRELPPKWQNKGIEKLSKITWQTWFEIMHNKSEGAYSSERADMLTVSTDKQFKPSILQKFRRRLMDGTNVLNLNVQDDQLMYFFVTYNKWYFAPSMNERRLYPRAKFYIEEQNAPQEETFKANVSMADTMYNLALLRKDYTTENLKQFGVVLKTTGMSESYETAYNSLQDGIVNNKLHRGDQKTFCEKFNNLFGIISRKGGKKRFSTLVLLQELIDYNIVGESGGTYTWYDKKGTELELIGKTKMQAIAWLLDEEKLVYRQMLEESLKKAR